MDDFFDDVRRRGHEPMLARVRASLRWDVVDGDRTAHLRLGIDRGDLEVSSSDGPADCVITATRTVCNEVVSGRTSPLAALVRGSVTVEGDPELMVLAQRLFHRTEPSLRDDPAPSGRAAP